MKITFRGIAAYVLGIPVALLGVLALFTNLMAGGLLFAGGILLLPIVRRKLFENAGIELSGGAAAAIFLVCAVAGVGTLALSAGDSSTAAGGAGSDVSNVSVTAEPVSPVDADRELAVAWNSRAQSAVDPDPNDMSIYRSNDGQKYFVVRMEITNTGEGDIELTPRLFKFETDGVIYDYQALFGSGQSFSSVTLTPGSSYSGWTVFPIPSDATDGMIVVDQDAYYNTNVSVSFEHNSKMPINMSSE